MNYGIVIYILGWVLTLESGFLLIPSLCALYYKEESGLSFLGVAIVFAILGILVIRKKPKNQQFFTKEGFATVGLSWIVMSIVGALPLYISGQIPKFIDALFEIVSGFTTTGASIVENVEALDHSSLLWRSFSHWIGGMGVFVFLLIILPMVSGNTLNLMKAESPGPSVGKIVPKIKDSARILYEIYFALTAILFIILLFLKMPVFDAICTSIGTAGTGGFGIKCDSMNSYSIPIQVVVTIFMILFGVNFNFYFFLLGKNKKNAFKIEEVWWYFAIIIASSLLITWNVRGLYGSTWIALKDAAFSVGSVITTTGFATADFNLWPSLSKTVLVLIMFIGACAGSTGGGIKVSRIIIVIRAMKQEVFTYVHPRSVKAIKMDGKPVEKSVIRAAVSFIALYALIYVVSLLIITFDGFDLVTNFTAITATLNNIGPGLEMVGPAGNFAAFSPWVKVVLIFDMLAGRLELYPILVLFAPSLWSSKR